MDEPSKQTRRSDWEIPAEIKNSLDPVSRALISEHDVDGIPAPYIFSVAVEVGDVSIAIANLAPDDNEGLAPLLDSAQGKIQEAESRYPGTKVWDRSKGVLVRKLIGAGFDNEALQLAFEIDDPHLAVDSLMDVSSVSDEAKFEEAIAAGIMAFENTERRDGLALALRDWWLVKSPESPDLTYLERALEVAGIESDHLAGWVDSQKAKYPNWDWTTIAETIQTDTLWGNVPRGHRRFFMHHYSMMLEEIIAGELDDEPDKWLDTTTPFLDRFEDSYNGAPIFDQMRANVSLSLLQNYPAQAVTLANTIRDSELGASVAAESARQGKEDEAIEIITNLEDHELIVLLLTSQGWEDAEAPIRRLTQIIESDDYPIEKRIGCIEAIVKGYREVGEYELAEKYQAIVDELRQQD